MVLNPYTGDILAMANYPAYDPNGLQNGVKETPGARSNLAVATPFEPGSVFKVVTLAAALETTNLTPDSIINCGNGTIKLFGRVIHDHNRYSSLSMADVLANSSNIGAINIGLKVGEKNLYEYVRKFGFGRKTGIELPGESAGMLRRLSQWEATSIGSVAMGHEVGATSDSTGAGRRDHRQWRHAREAPLDPGAAKARRSGRAHRAREAGARDPPRDRHQDAPDDGRRGAARHRQAGHPARLYLGRQDRLGADIRFQSQSLHAPLQRELPGFRAGIQSADRDCGDAGGNFGRRRGLWRPVAAPVFRAVATSALRMLDVPKDLPDTSPRLAKSSKRDENDLAIAGLGAAPPELAAAPAIDFAHMPSAVRSQSVSSVTTPPASGASSASAVEAPPGISFGTSPDRRPFLSAQKGIGPKVPDLRGLTLRAVLEESAATGLPIEVQGDGMARAQDPPPGTILAPGSRVHVQLTR